MCGELALFLNLLGQYSDISGEGRGGSYSLTPHLFLKPNNNRNVSQLLPS